MTDNKQEAIDQLQALIKDIGIAMLVTHDAGGEMHGRPMATQQAPFDGRLWFFTSAKNTKTRDLAQSPQVCLVYSDASKQRYVYITGNGRLVRDPAKVKELWRTADRLWFPGGPEDADLRLLEVTVERASWWTVPGMIGTAVAIVSALASGETPMPGDSGTLEFAPLLPDAPRSSQRVTRLRTPATNATAATKKSKAPAKRARPGGRRALARGIGSAH